jgi:hypothetical protein
MLQNKTKRTFNIYHDIQVCTLCIYMIKNNMDWNRCQWHEMNGYIPSILNKYTIFFYITFHDELLTIEDKPW